MFEIFINDLQNELINIINICNQMCILTNEINKINKQNH